MRQQLWQLYAKQVAACCLQHAENTLALGHAPRRIPSTRMCMWHKPHMICETSETRVAAVAAARIFRHILWGTQSVVCCSVLCILHFILLFLTGTRGTGGCLPATPRCNDSLSQKTFMTRREAAAATAATAVAAAAILVMGMPL